MSTIASVRRLDRRVRVVLLSLSVLCALLPAVAVMFAVDADYKRAALAHDAAITAEAASQVSLTIREVERQLGTAATFVGRYTDSERAIRSFLQAIESSNHELLQVGLLSGGGVVAQPGGGERLLDSSALPVYHGSSSSAYVSISVPVTGGRLAAALTGSAVTKRLRRLAAPPGASAYLFTTGGHLLTSSAGAPPHVSFSPVAGEHFSQRVLNGRGVFRGATLFVTETPIRGTNWVLLLENHEGGLLSSRFPVLFGGVSALIAALMALIAVLLFRGSSSSPTKRRLEDAVRRNEILMREMHHRVKNDLQILSSILHLSDRPGLAPGEHEILTESQNRVHAISLIHEMLYNSSDITSGVGMREYVSELVRRIEASLVSDTEAVSIVSNIGDFSLDAETSVACGLLINELLTNSLKYAFPNGDSGVILVRMERLGAGRYLMQVQDDGVGLPKECWSETNDSLGMRLIRALTEQLGGTVSIETDPGTSWRILFDAREIATASFP